MKSKPKYIHYLVSLPYEDMTATQIVADDIDELLVALMYDLEAEGFGFREEVVWLGTKYYCYDKLEHIGPSYHTLYVKMGVIK